MPAMADLSWEAAAQSWAFAVACVLVPVFVVDVLADFVVVLDELDPQAAVLMSAAPINGVAQTNRRACRMGPPSCRPHRCRVSPAGAALSIRRRCSPVSDGSCTS